MATEELFREDATLLVCAATVTAQGEGGVILDRTVCYPVGGGQAGDTGWLVAGEQRWRITDTRKSKEQPGAIVHLVEGELPAVGTAVQVEVDTARRQAHRRFHTATHLLCALLPYPVDGCSITEAYARLDFHTDEPFDKEAIQTGLTRLVAEAHPVTHRWISEEELDASRALDERAAAARAGAHPRHRRGGGRSAALRRHSCVEHGRDRSRHDHKDREKERQDPARGLGICDLIRVAKLRW